jgi:hypothetical protein
MRSSRVPLKALLIGMQACCLMTVCGTFRPVPFCERCMAMADEEPFTADELGAAEARKKAELKTASNSIRSLTEGISKARRSRADSLVRDLTQQRDQAKATLKAIEDKEIVEFAADVRSERLREDLRQKEAAAEAALKMAEKAKEGELHEQWLEHTQGCPLKPMGANFTVLKLRGLRPQTSITFQGTNVSQQRIIAYELTYRLIDGFDQTITSGNAKGKVIESGADVISEVSIEPYETAAQMRIYVERVRLEDGTVWERTPEHRKTGLLVEKFDGTQGSAKVLRD